MQRSARSMTDTVTVIKQEPQPPASWAPQAYAAVMTVVVLVLCGYICHEYYGNNTTKRAYLVGGRGVETAVGKQDRADAETHLALVASKAQTTMAYIYKKHFNMDGTLKHRAFVSKDGRQCDKKGPDCADITCAVARLLSKHYEHPKYPNAKLEVKEHRSSDNVLATNEDKGRRVSICVYPKEGEGDAPPEDTNVLFRVLAHELAHSMHCEYVTKRKHGPHFERLEHYLLRSAVEAGAYKCIDGEDGTVRVCGRSLPLSGMCSGKRTRRAPSSVAKAQDNAPEDAEGMSPKALAKQCTSQCSVVARSAKSVATKAKDLAAYIL